MAWKCLLYGNTTEAAFPRKAASVYKCLKLFVYFTLTASGLRTF